MKSTAGGGDLDDYVDEAVKYLPPTPLENNMNDGDPSRLAKYLDPEFLNATLDGEGVDAGRLEIEDKEHMSQLNLDLNDKEMENLIEENERIAMLAPREYQFELFQKALNENVITVLDTGTGKTLISVMLIKEMVSREREARLTRREVCFKKKKKKLVANYVIYGY
jgi:hypothetical protein